MDETLEIVGVIFIAYYQSAKVEKPGKESLNFPAPRETAQRTTVLSFDAPVAFVGGNHFGAVVLHQLLVQAVAVIGLVADQSFRHVRNHALVESCFNQPHFSRRSTFCPQGERKTMAVCNAHDFGALSALGLSDAEPPFLAGTNVPSTKHSL